MATIDYKQKIKDYMNSSEVDTLYKSMLINLFPEPKESEDERIREAIIKCLKWLRDEARWTDVYGSSFDSIFSWLEKQGEQKPAWSEEDETVLNNLIYALANDRIGNDRDEYISYLKSLKERYTWKPSKEQMQALSNAGNSFRPFEEGHKVLWSLYNDLKKLREE